MSRNSAGPEHCPRSWLGTHHDRHARRTLGVDVLRIETAEGDTPALEAGKYLTDQVYVGVKQGTTAQSSSAGVEIELTPNVTLESEITGQGANKSGVRFQWDY